MSTTRLFPLLLMGALALLTLWLDHQVRVEGGDHPSLRRHDPDYLVANFTTTTTPEFKFSVHITGAEILR